MPIQSHHNPWYKLHCSYNCRISNIRCLQRRQHSHLQHSVQKYDAKNEESIQVSLLENLTGTEGRRSQISKARVAVPNPRTNPLSNKLHFDKNDETVILRKDVKEKYINLLGDI